MADYTTNQGNVFNGPNQLVKTDENGLIPTSTYGGGVWGSITGTLSNQTDLQSALDGKSATGHTHAGADIASGTVPAARLGSGTTDSTTFLRGDNTWQTVSPGSAVWGSITGTLSSQTDLQNELNAKADIAGTETITGAWTHTGTTVVSNVGGVEGFTLQQSNGSNDEYNFLITAGGDFWLYANADTTNRVEYDVSATKWKFPAGADFANITIGGITMTTVGVQHRLANSNGYVDIGPSNTSWCHFFTDRPRYYFDSPLEAVTEIGIYNGGTPATRFTATAGYINSNVVWEDGIIGARINAMTADSTPDPASDYVITYDASATTNKKVLIQDLATVDHETLIVDTSTYTVNGTVAETVTLDTTVPAAALSGRTLRFKLVGSCSWNTSGGCRIRVQFGSMYLDTGTSAVLVLNGTNYWFAEGEWIDAGTNSQKGWMQVKWTTAAGNPASATSGKFDYQTATDLEANSQIFKVWITPGNTGQTIKLEYAEAEFITH